MAAHAHALTTDAAARTALERNAPDTVDVDPAQWRHHGRLDSTTAAAVQRTALADLTDWAAALLHCSGPRHPELVEPHRAPSRMVC